VELLSTLRSQGYSIGIVSSSKQETTAALLKKFQLSVDFSYQCTLFNKAKVLKQVLSEKNLSVTDVIYVGDEVRDIEACQKIGLPIIAVTWGLNSKEALQHTGVPTADTREALLAMLLT
ncbi:MAG: HAD-IA family hydrolase, partial [Candidatus Moranbacteria bacterium]|nr:HAD-IA family hydrolase [Candidatus Moranbacteria bacterium]